MCLRRQLRYATRMSTHSIDTSLALTHLRTADPRMATIVRAAVDASPGVAIPTAKHPDAYFPTLVRSIVSQQISTKAAASVFARLHSAVELHPEAIMQHNDATLRACGLSAQKVRYVRALAAQWSSLGADRFPALADEEIQRRVCACYGIGQWTAEMFLLFAMARPDIFSAGDLGLRQRVATHYDVSSDDARAIAELSERWSPHRSVVSLALWYELDNGPVLL